MRAADEVGTHQGILCPECISVYLIERVATAVTVAVAGRADKMAFTHPRAVKRRQHFLLVVAGDLIDLTKYRLKPLHCLLGRGKDSIIQLKKRIVHHTVCSLMFLI